MSNSELRNDTTSFQVISEISFRDLDPKRGWSRLPNLAGVDELSQPVVDEVEESDVMRDAYLRDTYLSLCYHCLSLLITCKVESDPVETLLNTLNL
ncbi:hypothetical protein AVEN_228105-1 [Araneus ventricosus]|uniref:Uncharacterized protein n=1 Tax=Araneus ventricosus TaxID=182803 RepID=A0A4Y2HR55_ARAVE|nr:hypothetical protein AVEN_228105-1 [Araneus ventricosus]